MRTICDRILKNILYPVGLLELYQQILHHRQLDIVDSPEEKELLLSGLVRSHIIDHWESQDEPEHWRTICDRILKNTLYPVGLLELYQPILHHGQAGVIDSPEAEELLLSGLVVKQQGVLEVHNRIYELIFDSSWVEDCR